jgi:sterol desaturase/sphingolipid hydroxylase (fatty acid hydroxylase superfamily)
MNPTYLGITNPLVYALPVFLLLIAIELYLSLKHERHIYEWKDLGASLSVGAGAGVLAIFTKAASIGMFFFFFEIFKPLRVAWLGYEHFGWAWYVWIICQFADDFSYYWYHRMSHEVRVLWAAHLVHHSSENFNLGSGVRNGWFTLFYKPLFWIWMAVIGFHPFMIATCLGIQAIYQFHLHTMSVPKLGFLEKFMNTPTQHQVHHSKNYEYLDKNHGGFLNIFDRLFGTFLDLDEKNKAQFGILKPPNSYNPLVIVTHEYASIWQDVKNAKTWKDKFMYVFGPPGWCPDSSSQTVKQIQAQLKNS